MTDLHGRLAERLDFGKEFDITKGEILALADSFFRENGRDSRSFDMGKMAAVLADRGCTATQRLSGDAGQRKEGWRGVRLVPDVQVLLLSGDYVTIVFPDLFLYRKCFG
jgi:hypothetical protein